MALLRRRRFTRTADGRYQVRLRGEERAILAALPDQFDALMASGATAATVRLFPPAYSDEPEFDAEYRRLMADELVRRRQEAVALVRATLERDRLTEDELQAWIGMCNDLRLVLGTLLDVSEDRDVLDVDRSSEDMGQRVLYVLLSEIVDEGVHALSQGLPPPIEA
jgi:Lon protease-like protein